MIRLKQRDGFILISTLMIIALGVILVNYMFYKGTVFLPVSKTYIEKERAFQLAEGGVQLAMSQLAYAGWQQNDAQQKNENDKTEKVSQEKKILESLLPILNTWQTFTFDQQRDGIEGALSFYIASEDGKININELYDFKKHTFIGSPKSEKEELQKTLQTMFSKIKGGTGQSKLFESFEKFLKGRQYKLQDVTELLTIKEFGELFKEHMFIEMPLQNQKKDEGSQKMSFTDIFTLWSSGKVDVTLLSKSVGTLLGLPWPWGKKEKIAPLLKNFNAQYQWPQSWKSFYGTIYKKDFNALPKGIEKLLAGSFDPKFFSVMSYAQIGEMRQGLYAIIERESTKDVKQPAKVILKKLYWN